MPSGTVYRYLDFLWHSCTRYRVHSPFIYRFAEEVLRNRSSFEGREAIEALRRGLKADQRVINKTDLGAGLAGRGKGSYMQQVSKTETRSGLPSFRALQLYHLSRFIHAGLVIELGTSFGITSAYLAHSVRSRGKLYTLEGCMDTAAIAGENFKKLGLENIELVTGPFDEMLPSVIGRMSHFDLAFIDGNHTYESTIRYFTELVKKSRDNSVIVIDDIHWSEDMLKAWNEICRYSDVRVTVDLFRMGIIFFRKGLSRQHFRLRY